MRKWLEPKAQIPEERKQFSDRRLMQIIVPTIVEQFLILLVGIIDTMMISYAGEAAVSGVSLVNQVSTACIVVFMAVASGGSVVAGQYIGHKEKEPGIRSASQLLMLTIVTSLVVTIPMLAFGNGLIGLLFGRAEADVQEAARIYLKISAYSFPFLAIYNSCGALYRSMGNTGIIMKVSILMNVINIVGNYIGVFVLRVGVAGVAYPTLLSRVVAAAVMFYLSLRTNQVVYVRPREVLLWDGGMVRRILGIAIPNAVENGLFQTTKVALTSIVAVFGTAQIAAYGVAQSLWSMSALFCLAMGPAFITVVAQYMGAGDSEGAQYYMRKLLRITLVGSCLWNLFFLLVTPVFLIFYNMDAGTKQLVFLLVLMHNVFDGLFAPPGFTFSNGLRAAGDVRYAMFVSVFTSIVCRFTLTILFGIIMHMGVVGVTLAMICDWGLKSLFIQARFRSGKWKQFHVI